MLPSRARPRDSVDLVRVRFRVGVVVISPGVEVPSPAASVHEPSGLGSSASILRSVVLPRAGVRLDVVVSSRRRLEDAREVVEFREERELSREGPGLVVLAFVFSSRRRTGSAERRRTDAAWADATLPRGSALGAVLVVRRVPARTCSRGEDERLLSLSLCTLSIVQFPLQASAGSSCL